MSLNLTPTTPGVSAVSPPRITVIGVGGGGVNAVNTMIDGNLRGVNFIAANTDAQQLALSKAETRLQLGPALTRGLGAGARPEVGRKSAEEVEDELRQHFEGVDLVFVTAGMGGGTGTGAAPVVARLAHEAGALTIGVVSKPFDFEGSRRGHTAETGIAELEKYVDTLLVIPNQNLFINASPNTTLKDAFKMADDVLYNGIRSVTDLMVEDGLINLDFADVRTVMSGMGRAMMGIGTANAEEDGEDWAVIAAERAISNPLLEETSIEGARALLVNVTFGEGLGILPFNQVMNLIRETANSENEEIICGCAEKADMAGKLQVSVIATGLNGRPRYDISDNIVENTAAASSQPGEEAPSEETSDDITGQEGHPATHEENAASHHTSEETNGHAEEKHAPASPAGDGTPSSSTKQPSYNPTGYNNGPQEHKPPQQPAPEPHPAHTGGGLFSRFFKIRPAAEPDRKDPSLSSNHAESSHGHGTSSSPIEDDDLNIPTYLRRGPK